MNYIIIFCAKYLFLLIVILSGVVFWQLPKQKKKEMIIFSIISLPVIFLLSRVMAKLYFNPRPFVVENFLPLISHLPDNGFPSDHTLLSAALSMLVYYFNKKMGWLLLEISLIVGLARVAAGVHHLTDIFGSIIISFFVSVLVYQYIIKPRFSKNIN